MKRIWLNVEIFEKICHSFEVQKAIEQNTEPIPPFRERYKGVLESCLETPRQTYAGRYLYQTIIDQAAILFYLLIKNHPFVNGNKRLAIAGLLFFLLFNDKWLRISQGEMYQLTVRVASTPAEEKSKTLSHIKSVIRRHLIDERWEGQCKVITKAGSRCSRRSISHTEYCWQHIPVRALEIYFS